LTIECRVPHEHGADLFVVDALGRTVGTLHHLDGSTEVSLSGLGPGVYTVLLQAGGSRASARFVVLR
jgi:hypothetical protein